MRPRGCRRWPDPARSSASGDLCSNDVGLVGHILVVLCTNDLHKQMPPIYAYLRCYAPASALPLYAVVGHACPDFITLSQKKKVCCRRFCTAGAEPTKTCPFRPGTALFQLAQQRHDGGCGGQQGIATEDAGAQGRSSGPCLPGGGSLFRGKAASAPVTRPMRSRRPSGRGTCASTWAAATAALHSRTAPGHTGQRCGTPPQSWAAAAPHPAARPGRTAGSLQCNAVIALVLLLLSLGAATQYRRLKNGTKWAQPSSTPWRMICSSLSCLGYPAGWSAPPAARPRWDIPAPRSAPPGPLQNRQRCRYTQWRCHRRGSRCPPFLPHDPGQVVGICPRSTAWPSAISVVK